MRLLFTKVVSQNNRGDIGPVRVTVRSPHTGKYLLDCFALSFTAVDPRKVPLRRLLSEVPDWFPTGRRLPFRSWEELLFYARMERYEAEQRSWHADC